MNYTEYKPSNKLRDIVKNYWRFDVPANSKISFPLNHETLPHAEMSIVFIKQPYFEGIRFLGPHIRGFKKTIYPDSFYFGIRLLPWINFTPSIFDKQQIKNLTTDCPKIITKHFNFLKFDEFSESKKLIFQIEESLTKLFTETVVVSQNDYIKYICLELSNGKSVGSTIENLPISIRVIQKKFKDAVGMSMRDYHNIGRQRRLWTELFKTNKNKSDLLYAHGFFDQAHFINDFKRQMNQSHTSFENRLRRIKISLV